MSYKSDKTSDMPQHGWSTTSANSATRHW